MSIPVIIFNADKGGVGKTTLSTHVAAGLACRGHTVVLMDTDPQFNATAALGLRPEPGFYNLTVREMELPEVIRPVAPGVYEIPGQEIKGHLYCVPSNRESMLVQHLYDHSNPLVEAIRDVRGVDVIIMDTPATPGHLMEMLYGASRYLVAPAQLERPSLQNLGSMIAAIQARGIELLAIVPNQVRATRLHGHNHAQLVKRAREKRWPLAANIRQLTAWGEAAQVSRMVWTLIPERSLDRSEAVRSIFKVVDMVEKGIAHDLTPKS